MSVDPRTWRRTAGRVAATLNTPLPAVLAMPWGEMLLWRGVARDIDADTWGLMRGDRDE